MPVAARMLGPHVALGGGGGLVHWLVTLFIWHEIFRVIFYVWHIHTFGPIIVAIVVLGLIGLAFWRRQRGPFRRQRWLFGRRRVSGSTGYGTGSGPRDW
jgi:hypothetical protein